jgi:ribonucleoside-diphosphate reductase alpha chain
VGDSIENIFDAIKYTAMIHKTGGGTGFSFSRLRPKGDIVKSTKGVASGPISFMKVFDSATDVIKQGGKRRGANMGMLRVDHPDILEFIVCKEKEGTLSNFNISVGITDKFMKAVVDDKDYELTDPKTGRIMNRIKARAVWNLILTIAWKTGDPGVVFIDKINSSASNPVPSLGPVESTNPCGEQPLYPFDSCNLGSVNLSKMITEREGKNVINWEKIRETVRKAVHFLDNVIDANKYPIPQIEQMTKRIRRIGLGVMGFADMLILLGIPYNSEEALKTAESLMKFITEEARRSSVKLGEERGSFPEFKNSVWYKLGYKTLRNSTVSTVAPTGTISIISGGCSQGIEPLYSVAYMRHVGESLGSNLFEINSLFEKTAIKEGFYSEELIRKIAKATSLQNVEEIPLNMRKIFVTAHDISPEWHVKMQAAFQKYTDNAVSKTINFPHMATPHDVEKAYLLAYQLGCKGITIYRDGSKEIQILTPVREDEPQNESFNDPLLADYNGGCSHCTI